MPVRDDDLTRALRDAAPPVDAADDVHARVAAKRARRATTRRARVGVLGALVIALGIGGVALAVRDNEDRSITTPAASTTTIPAPAGWTSVKLATDEGYLRGPLTLSQSGGRTLVSVAAYDRDAEGGFSFPPSRIVRFDPTTMKVVDRVDLKAEILAVVDGDDGIRFALTRNPDPEGPTLPGLFLKSIASDGGVRSTPLPPGTNVPPGALQLGQSSDGQRLATVATAAGVLAYDSDLAPATHLYQGPSITWDASGLLPFPRGFAPSSSGFDGPRGWLEGRQDGVPAVMLLDTSTPRPTRILDLLTFPGGTDITFAWVDDHTVMATSGGRLYRHSVP